MRQVDGLLLDIDGVLAVSWDAIPGAAEAVQRIREATIPFALVTNTTTLSRDRIAASLGAAGIPVDASEVLTAAAATARYVRSHHPGASVLLVAGGDAAEEFGGVTLADPAADDADVVVIGGVTEEEGFGYGELNAAFRAVMNGAALVAMHRSLWWRTASGPRLDTAALLPGIEEASGVRATVVGKPSRAFFAEALRAIGRPAERVAMVGDDIEGDIRGAQTAGLVGILVRTGKFRERDLASPGRAPDVIVDSIADVPDLVETLGSG